MNHELALLIAAVPAAGGAAQDEIMRLQRRAQEP